MQFKDYHFKAFIEQALEQENFDQPTEVQEEVIPLLRDGESLVVQSQTGSGKTLAFLLPLFEKLENKAETQAVIIAPSRELAGQLYEVAQKINQQRPSPFLIERAFGGTDTDRQAERLEGQTPALVIGTPGRLLDLVKQQLLNVHRVRMLIIDEADMTLDMGFLDVVDQFASRMPEDLQMAVFSATIPDAIQPFLEKYLNRPQWLLLDEKHVLPKNIKNALLLVKSQSKLAVLEEVLTLGEPYLALIFANTIKKVEELHHELKNRGLNVCCLHGDLPSRKRRQIIRRINNLDFQYVVATDLAARGIDIEGVSHVVNYEIPEDLSFLIHRLGRTGRLGRQGFALTLLTPNEESKLQYLEEKGLHFEAMSLENGRMVPTEHSFHLEVEKNVDHQIRGMVKRAQKKPVKPGYKKKLSRHIKQYKHQKSKEKRRQQERQRRKGRRDSQRW